VLGKKPADLTGSDRQLAKAVNFGLLYGQGPKGLVTYARAAYGMELTEEEATDIRTRFFNHYKGLAAWHKTAWDNAPGLTEGRTVLGRRRLLSPDAPIWQRFLVQINFVVQGSCADTLKLAMLYLAQRLPQGAQLVATVHDELVIEDPESIAEQVRSTTIKAMRDGFEKMFPGVPIDVQAKICKRWSKSRGTLIDLLASYVDLRNLTKTGNERDKALHSSSIPQFPHLTPDRSLRMPAINGNHCFQTCALGASLVSRIYRRFERASEFS
jgi:DNA polymerase I-like protein with 3'-5' exonuclease and polymerase domains